MAPALVAVGTYALLLAWNEYLYQFLLLSNDAQHDRRRWRSAQFLNSDVAPWNYMMATAIVYALPPIATYYMFRRRMSSGLDDGWRQKDKASAQARQRKLGPRFAHPGSRLARLCRVLRPNRGTSRWRYEAARRA